MIILHEKNENAYKSNGLGLLDKKIIDPKVLWKLNGEYTFSFKYPLHAALGSEIKNGMQVEVVSDALSDVFRIQVTEQSMGYITAYCEQKSYDLIDNFIEDINIVNCTGVDAIKRIQNAMVYPHPFILSSTITDVKNARMIRLGGMQALMDQRLANSFLSRWGGEIERSYNEVKIIPHIGQDFGVKIQYRKDLIGYKAKIDSSTVVTRIRPVGFNGLSLPEKYVDSARIDPKHPKIKKIKYEKAKAALGQYKNDKDAVPESEALEMLRRFAAEDFRKGIDQPTATYDVDFVLLKNTEEYRDISNLQTIRGGDTVTVEHALDGFFVSARCVQFEYNPLTGEYISMRLGNVKEALSETLTTSRDLEALREEQQAIQHSYMDEVSKEIEKTWRNEDGYNYELKKENPFDLPAGYYSFNAPIDQNPTKVIGISAGSLVISNRRQSDGKWDFRTFGDGSGFTADLIRAGMLQGGNVRWNLETGYLNIGDEFRYIPGTGLVITGQAKEQLKGDKGDKGDAGAPGKDGTPGKDGAGVKSAIYEYAVSTSGQTAPTEGWSEEPPNVGTEIYVWRRVKTTYTDDRVETSTPECMTSKEVKDALEEAKTEAEKRVADALNYISVADYADKAYLDGVLSNMERAVLSAYEARMQAERDALNADWEARLKAAISTIEAGLKDQQSYIWLDGGDVCLGRKGSYTALTLSPEQIGFQVHGKDKGQFNATNLLVDNVRTDILEIREAGSEKGKFQWRHRKVGSVDHLTLFYVGGD